MTESILPMELPHVVDQTARRKLIESHGTTNQLERYLAGLLPDDELHALARGVLFAPFAGFRRWIKLAPADLMHRRGCRGDVTFRTQEVEDLEADEWSKFKDVRDVLFANDGILRANNAHGKVEIVEHIGQCSLCGNECSARAAAVKIDWAGRPLSREYSLEDVR